jgi:hypothetical protein
MAKSYDVEKAWSSINHSILSAFNCIVSARVRVGGGGVVRSRVAGGAVWLEPPTFPHLMAT